MNKKNTLTVLLLILGVLVLPHLFNNPYYIGVMAMIGVYCLITIGLSLLMGYAGQISLGHAAFYGIGAYGSGILSTRLDFPVYLSIGLTILISGLLALAIGIPALRLKGHYLAMATLAFGVIVYVFFEAAVELTGGPSGLAGIPMLSIGKWKVYSELRFYYLVWVLVVGVLILALNIVHSRVGRALRSIHSAETATRAMGVDVSIYKIQMFVLSACLAALAGALYAHFMMYISPSSFDFKFSVTLVTMVAVGGMASLWGALAGTILLGILPEYLSGFNDYYLLIYGGILVAIMMFVPQGFLVGMGQGLGLLWNKIRRRSEATA